MVTVRATLNKHLKRELLQPIYPLKGCKKPLGGLRVHITHSLGLVSMLTKHFSLFFFFPKSEILFFYFEIIYIYFPSSTILL
jgi:hypothetical protein